MNDGNDVQGVQDTQRKKESVEIDPFVIAAVLLLLVILAGLAIGS